MHPTQSILIQRRPRFMSRRFLALLALFGLALSLPIFGEKKKKNETAAPPVIDYSNIVWPNPPAIARVRYQAFYAAEKLSQVDTPKTKKDSWMDRLAGTQPQAESGKVLWQTTLDTEGHTNPMTFMGRNGKQYVVIVSSGLNAFALP